MRRDPKSARSGKTRGRVVLALCATWAIAGGAFLATSCTGWDPKKPFERNAPEVDQALADLDAGRLDSAVDFLERYLGTGACADGGIGLPDSVRQKPSGSFDLGLSLFYIAERFGQRFGDEEMSDGGSPEEAQLAELRGAQIDCALVVVKAIAADDSVPVELRARAYYLTGNLEFLRKNYEEAVKLYDQAIALVPGVLEEAGGDVVGRDAAWNRAIALRRIEDNKDAGQDAPDADEPDADPPDADEPDAPDSGDDGGDDAGPDSGDEDAGDQGDGGDQDDEADAGADDAGSDGGQEPDAGQQPEPKPEEAPPPPQMLQDDRILDQLEEAPTYQEQEAKARAAQRRGRTMEDK